jgi:hypothetical protein
MSIGEPPARLDGNVTRLWRQAVSNAWGGTDTLAASQRGDEQKRRSSGRRPRKRHYVMAITRQATRSIYCPIPKNRC